MKHVLGSFPLGLSLRSSEVARVERYTSTLIRCTQQNRSHTSLVASIDDLPQCSLLSYLGIKPRYHRKHTLQRIFRLSQSPAPILHKPTCHFRPSSSVKPYPMLHPFDSRHVLLSNGVGSWWKKLVSSSDSRSVLIGESATGSRVGAFRWRTWES